MGTMTTDNHDQALEARANALLSQFIKHSDFQVERDGVIRAIIAALREGQKAGG